MRFFNLPKNTNIKIVRENYVKEFKVTKELRVEPCEKFVAIFEKLSKNYTKTKKIKDLNYKAWRCPQMLKILTEEEQRYIIDDVIILNEYWNSNEIQRYIKKQGYTKIPLTNTAKVRMMLYNSVDSKTRKEIVDKLASIFPTLDIYQMLLRGFSGGVVKSNPRL